MTARNYLCVGPNRRVWFSDLLELGTPGMEGVLIMDLVAAARHFGKLVQDPFGTFNLHQAAAVAGSTHRNIQYWLAWGVVVPSGPRGHGVEIKLTFAETFAVACLGALQRAGQPPGVLRKVYRLLTAEVAEADGEVEEAEVEVVQERTA